MVMKGDGWGTEGVSVTSALTAIVATCAVCDE